MNFETTKDLIERLNFSDECTNIEAKKATNIHRSIIESVCAFANEPGLGGGNILLGIEREEGTLFPSYIVCGVSDPDKLQLDLSTQCASMLNQPIRPEIKVDKINDKIVLNIFIPELPNGQKPAYFKNEGLPAGAYRRIGSSDQRCTDDDLFIFYNKEDSLDSTIIKDTSLDDVSDEALSLYRNLRQKVNNYAEELQYNDIELLQALGCLKKDNSKFHLTYCGLLVFGKKMSLRRLLPMVRVDYIRVPGNEWVRDPENKFTTIDMRGSLIELVQRTFSAIADDLPKGFLLHEDAIQAESIGLPNKVLREAIVNAFIHRTYRENQPIQIIRYGNRIEITNPGFSLKPQDSLGEPGSKNRNPFIASIFHETNLAETKGSGIRTMRSLMKKASLSPPTFESDHTKNQFTARILLHHFLNEQDVEWLKSFADQSLSDGQKRGLILLREIGAIDNSSYRQLNGVDIMKSSQELRNLREKDIIIQKGKGRATYYVPNKGLTHWQGFTDQNDDLWWEYPDFIDDIEDFDHLSAPVQTDKIDLSAPVLPDYLDENMLSAPVLPEYLDENMLSAPVNESLVHQLPDDIQNEIKKLPQRVLNPQLIEEVIIKICDLRPYKSSEIAGILGKTDKYILRTFISPLKEKGSIEYTIPDMPNHPEQAYITIKK
ncbi:MAG: putative DNA binding domain-containing protein [Saprospiraceae bacterium]|nr:putative DNA binding domain-containing protein [Saprospiraceae bacterium]